MSELKLKNCPFCGGNDIHGPVVEYIENAPGYGYTVFHVGHARGIGMNCGASVTENTADKAIERWNRRTQPEATKPAQDLGAAIPDGWQLVPKKPTENMLAEYKEFIRTGRYYMDVSIWNAMLKAAPTAPADAPEAGDTLYKWLANRVLVCDYGDNDTKQIGWRLRQESGPIMFGESIDAAIRAAIQAQKDGS